MKPRRPGTFAHLRAKLPGSLPPRCFISHGFRDQEGLARLQARLPWYVEPRIFPEVAEAPDSTISEQLVGAILDCPGLIYIASEESLSRPYVSFERDYAVRAGRKLYRFENGDFVRERRAPLNLHAFASYHRADREKVRVIQEFMERRHFGVLKDTGDIIDREEDWLGSVKGNIRKTLDAGGHFVYFVSNSTLRSGMDAFELNEAAQYRPGAILAALLEPAALHDLPEAIKGRAVKLYREDGDVADLDWRKVDRLIVQIYHLVHNEPAR